MNPLKKLIADTHNKIDEANPNFCGTPDLTPMELAKRMAKSIILGEGDPSDLLNSACKKTDKKFKNKRGCT